MEMNNFALILREVFCTAGCDLARSGTTKQNFYPVEFMSIKLLMENEAIN